MQLYVELWSAQPAWHELSTEERQNYLGKIGETMPKLMEAGIELVGFTHTGTGIQHRAPYDYMAAWKMPSMKEIHMLESIVEEAGWHTYFNQVNACGEMISVDETIGHMINESTVSA